LFRAGLSAACRRRSLRNAWTWFGMVERIVGTIPPTSFASSESRDYGYELLSEVGHHSDLRSRGLHNLIRRRHKQPSRPRRSVASACEAQPRGQHALRRWREGVPARELVKALASLIDREGLSHLPGDGYKEVLQDLHTQTSGSGIPESFQQLFRLCAFCPADASKA
jgi:hypothetical protein